MKKIVLALMAAMMLVSHFAKADDDTIYGMVQNHFGGSDIEAGVRNFCQWDTIPRMTIGAAYAIGAVNMPHEVCFSVIRLFSIQMANETWEGRLFNYEPALLTFKTQTKTAKGEKLETIATCGTQPIKQPFEQFTPVMRENIKQIMRTKGFEAGLKELEKFLNRNIQLTCVYS